MRRRALSHWGAAAGIVSLGLLVGAEPSPGATQARYRVAIEFDGAADNVLTDAAGGEVYLRKRTSVARGTSRPFVVSNSGTRRRPVLFFGSLAQPITVWAPVSFVGTGKEPRGDFYDVEGGPKVRDCYQDVAEVAPAKARMKVTLFARNNLLTLMWEAPRQEGVARYASYTCSDSSGATIYEPGQPLPQITYPGFEQPCGACIGSTMLPVPGDPEKSYLWRIEPALLNTPSRGDKRVRWFTFGKDFRTTRFGRDPVNQPSMRIAVEGGYASWQWGWRLRFLHVASSKRR